MYKPKKKKIKHRPSYNRGYYAGKKSITLAKLIKRWLGVK